MTQGVLPPVPPQPPTPCVREPSVKGGGEGEGNEPREPPHGQVCPYHNGRNSGAEKKGRASKRRTQNALHKTHSTKGL